jgi:hypothetical protein
VTDQPAPTRVGGEGSYSSVRSPELRSRDREGKRPRGTCRQYGTRARTIRAPPTPEPVQSRLQESKRVEGLPCFPRLNHAERRHDSTERLGKSTETAWKTWTLAEPKGWLKSAAAFPFGSRWTFYRRPVAPPRPECTPCYHPDCRRIQADARALPRRSPTRRRVSQLCQTRCSIGLRICFPSRTMHECGGGRCRYQCAAKLWRASVSSDRRARQRDAAQQSGEGGLLTWFKFSRPGYVAVGMGLML